MFAELKGSEFVIKPVQKVIIHDFRLPPFTSHRHDDELLQEEHEVSFFADFFY